MAKKMNRFLAATVKFSTSYPVVIITGCITVTILAIFLLMAKGVDTANISSEDSVYAQVEFDGGLLAQEVDRLLSIYSRQLLEVIGIKNVETGARIGSGSLLISFDPNLTNASIVREEARKIDIPGGFVFFHESSVNERFWEIIIYGDEDQKCRELARELANILTASPLVRDRVLNFKDGSAKIILHPDREIFANSNLSFSTAASRARLGVYGPVAYKRIDVDGETDVRIRTGNNNERQSREGTLGLLVTTRNEESISSLRMETLMRVTEETEPSSIRRDNRRRNASITISTRPMDPRRVKQELSNFFNRLELPSGYSIEFDPQAIKDSEGLTATVFSLVMAVIFCYMIMASINESFTVPLLVLCAIGPSLAIPAIVLVLLGSSYNTSIACAFIVVSGMTVNAAILCVDGILVRSKAMGNKVSALTIYLSLRKKLPALLATTVTTIAGALPFLFLTEGANVLIRTLSLVSALGVACSSLCSVTLIPSLSILKHHKFRLRGIKKLLGEKYE